MLVHDIRLAIRNLAHRPAFTLTAILLLALGAGANAAVVSVVRGVLWLPLPFGAPERLVAVWPDQFVSNEEVAFWRERARRLEQVGSLSPGWLMALAVDGAEPQKVTGAKVSDNLFALLQVHPSLGRTFTDGESTPGRDRVAVLSDRLWRQQFAADPAVLGRMVLVDQVPYSVIGVMPNTFELFGRESDLWVPIPFAPGTPANRATFSLAIGRLRPGATVESASGELLALAPEMRGALSRPADWGHTIRVAALHDAITGQVRPALRLLFVAVGLILLLGAVNLGTLVLGRSLERSRELAIRAAIGASRRQILRQLLVEQVVLAATGSLIGLALAQVFLPLLLSRIPPEVPRQAEIALDGVVFATILATSIGLALALAVAPVLLAISPGLQPLLRQQAATDSPGRGRALGGLVAAQIGLALVLGTGAGLMLRSVWNLQHVEPGFNADGVLSFRLQTTSKYRALATGVPYLQQVAERVRSLPGVTAVGGIGHLPMSGYSWTIPVHRVDQPPAGGESAAEVGWRFIWGDYLEAMRIPVISGRSFTDADTISATRVAIVNEALARQFFGSPAAALGQRLVQKGGGSPDDTIVEIVGIVGDVRHEALNEPPRPELFRPLLQTFMFPMHMVAGTVGAPADLALAVRRAAFDVDPTVPVAELMPLTTLLADTLGKPRLLALLLSLFAAVGVLQSVVALYGVIAVRVRQREREFGIRMALGALPGMVAIGVIRQGLGYAVLGMAVGVPASLALTRLMDSVVFGVTTRDPLTFSVLPVLLTMVTMAACYLPARRAARVDPVRAMKAE